MADAGHHAGHDSGQIVVATMELGIFDQFENGPLSVNALADRTDADPDGIAVPVRALVALGYLVEENSGYRLTDPARRSLPDQNRQLMGTWFAEYMRLCADAARGVARPPRMASSVGRQSSPARSDRGIRLPCGGLPPIL